MNAALASGRAHAPGAGPHAPAGGLVHRPWWPWTRRLLTLAFFGLVAWLLVHQGRSIDWPEVWARMRALPPAVLATAAVLACASHLLYASFDLLGRRITGHRLPTPRVMAVTFVSYAFNLNMGALVGGVASRYRLYSRLGLGHLQVTQILLMSMLTNWMGYLLLGGLALLLFPLRLPPEWEISEGALRGAGALLVLAALAYVALCQFSRAHRLQWRGRTLRLPTRDMALLQLAMSSLNWALIAATIHVLTGQQLPYATVLTVLLLAAVAGVVTHVPAGLGVLEAVFIALLSDRMPVPALLGSLLAYRALYYLAPLALAVLLFAAMEIRHRRPS